MAFTGEEVQAQQPPQAQHKAVGEQVVGDISQTPVEATPTGESSPWETRLARTSPFEPESQPALVRPGSPVEEPSPAASDPTLADPERPVRDTLPDLEPVPGSALQSDTVTRSTTVLAEQDGPKTPLDPYLALAEPRPTTSGPVTEPTPGVVPVAPVDQETAPGTADPDHSPLDPGPEQVAIEESNALPLLTGEVPAVEPAVLYAGEEGAYYVLGTSLVGVVATLEGNLESAAANAFGVMDYASSWSAAVEGEGLVDTTLAGLFYGEAARHAPASEPNGETKSSPTGTESEWPLQDSGPQPVSPFTPPVGSSFSLSGGQVGTGIVALLLYVLASGLILLQREFKLFWAFCELPKPSSVLILPPERPG